MQKLTSNKFCFLLVLVLLGLHAQTQHYYPLKRSTWQQGSMANLFKKGQQVHWLREPSYFSSLKTQLLNGGYKTGDFRFKADSLFAELGIKRNPATATALLEMANQMPNEYHLQVYACFAAELLKDADSALHYADKALNIYEKGNWDAMSVQKQWLSSLKSPKTPSSNPAEQSKNIPLSSPFYPTFPLAQQEMEKWMEAEENKWAPSDPLLDTLARQLILLINWRQSLLPEDISILYIHLGDLSARTGNRTDAIPFYEKASSFTGTATTIEESKVKALIKERMNWVSASKRSVGNTFSWASLIWMIPILAIGIAFIGNVLNRRKAKSEI
jgi:tetratricopeptide (TPR) repeat protein